MDSITNENYLDLVEHYKQATAERDEQYRNVVAERDSLRKQLRVARRIISDLESFLLDVDYCVAHGHASIISPDLQRHLEGRVAELEERRQQERDATNKRRKAKQALARKKNRH